MMWHHDINNKVLVTVSIRLEVMFHSSSNNTKIFITIIPSYQNSISVANVCVSLQTNFYQTFCQRKSFTFSLNRTSELNEL